MNSPHAQCNCARCNEDTRLIARLDYIEAHADEGGTGSSANLVELVEIARQFKRERDILARPDDMIADATIGKAMMSALEAVTAEPGPFKDWTPAECPSEIITDLFAALTEGSPIGFQWLDHPVCVVGNDYSYAGVALLSFPKGVGGPKRYIVMDQNRRLFIHNGVQCGFEIAAPNVNLSPRPDGEGRITVPFNPCLAKLREGEPFFVLLGRDKQSPEAVTCWADARERAEGKSDWTEQARDVANEMATYSEAATPPQTSPAVAVTEEKRESLIAVVETLLPDHGEFKFGDRRATAIGIVCAILARVTR